MLGGALGGLVFALNPGRHYFHGDEAANNHNVAALLAQGTSLFYLGHGGPVTAEAVRGWLKP